MMRISLRAVAQYLFVSGTILIVSVLLLSDKHLKRSEFIDIQHKPRLELGRDDQLLSVQDFKNFSSLELRQQVLSTSQNRQKNSHPFHYLLTPTSVCSGDIFLLVYVHSAPRHFKRRMMIRETWANAANFPDITIKVIFLCGIISTADRLSIQDALSLEADIYGDILQEDFVDTYRNLTFKAIMGLKWISSHCRHAEFLLKADDDIFINIFRLVAHLRRISSQRRKPVRKLLLCFVWYRGRVFRNRRSKWYVSEAEYPNDTFPTFCSGSALVMTPDVALELFDASFRVPFFWIDDVYMTGLLAREVGVSHEAFNSMYMFYPNEIRSKFARRKLPVTLIFGHVHTVNLLKLLWYNVLVEQRRRK